MQRKLQQAFRIPLSLFTWKFNSLQLPQSKLGFVGILKETRKRHVIKPSARECKCHAQGRWLPTDDHIKNSLHLFSLSQPHFSAVFSAFLCTQKWGRCPNSPTKLQCKSDSFLHNPKPVFWWLSASVMLKFLCTSKKCVFAGASLAEGSGMQCQFS